VAKLIATVDVLLPYGYSKYHKCALIFSADNLIA